VENIADHRTIGPRKFFMLAERKKGGKKKGERRKRKERKEGKGKKKNRKKERVTAPISGHFVQGQTLGVGGAPKIIYKRTLIAEFYPLSGSTPFQVLPPLLALYRTTALVPKFAICIAPLPP
jgi:hypothetical protein